MAKFWLVSATIFGFLSVALGAFGAHSLKHFLDEYGKAIYEKAVIYQMLQPWRYSLSAYYSILSRILPFPLQGGDFLSASCSFPEVFISWPSLVRNGLEPLLLSVVLHSFLVGSAFHCQSSKPTCNLIFDSFKKIL